MSTTARQVNVVDNAVGTAEIAKVGTPQQRLDRFRNRAGLPAFDAADGATGTVARTEIEGREFFGVNSGLSPASVALRSRILARMQEAGLLTGKRLNQVRTLTHAEAHALMRAFDRLGTLPRVVVLHVDRLTCNFCAGRNGLEQLRQFFGIEKLTVVSRSGKIWNFPR